jgi:Fungal chitosanase of glycosyl hydrolase group 75
MVMRKLDKILSAAIALALPVSTMANGLQTAPPSAAANACPASSLLLTFDVYRLGELRKQAPVWQLGGGPAFFFKSGLAVDADGAPNAYNADDTGLDHLYNAGQPGQWNGIVQDEDGNPLVQGPDDPFPGFYISCTALFDRTKHRSDPARFVDATQIPYVALPGDLARQTGARLGDFVFVYSEQTGKFSFAIFADIGAFGEGSIALANNLGIRSDARRGGSPAGVSYLVFPGSGDGQPKSVDEINRMGNELLASRGGTEKVLGCAGMSTRQAEAQSEANDPAAAAAAGQPVSPGRSPADAAAN